MNKNLNPHNVRYAMNVINQNMESAFGHLKVKDFQGRHLLQARRYVGEMSKKTGLPLKVELRMGSSLHLSLGRLETQKGIGSEGGKLRGYH